jgi:hypothetical protein
MFDGGNDAAVGRLSSFAAPMSEKAGRLVFVEHIKVS